MKKNRAKQTRQPSSLPVALTIAGSDSGGGAGAQADLLTFAAHGVFGTTAITALTAQNPDSVSGVIAVSPDFVREQAEQVARFFKICAAKTGMLANAKIIHAVADFFENHREIALVVDPVMISTSGAKLLDDDAISALRERLIPLAAVVTPNLDEAEVLLGENFAWRKNPETRLEDISATAKKLARALGVPALVKGGHGLGGKVYNALAFPQKTKIYGSASARIEKINTHGSGCTLSAAIAANLAKTLHCKARKIDAETLAHCVAEAEVYVHHAIEKPVRVGDENFIAHLRKPRSREKASRSKQ